MKKRQYRQGDVLLIETSDIPAAANKLPREEGLVILARGEATGHHHSLRASNVRLYAVADEFTRVGSGYVDVKGRAAVLRHQEHAPISVPSSNYRVVRQREYSEQAIQMVAD